MSSHSIEDSLRVRSGGCTPLFVLAQTLRIAEQFTQPLVDDLSGLVLADVGRSMFTAWNDFEREGIKQACEALRRLEEGMTLAVEPLVRAGVLLVRVDDGGLSAVRSVRERSE